MSKVLVHGADNVGAGDFVANVARGWSLAGVASQSGGGSVIITLPTEAAAEPWLQLGALIYIEHPVLGPWAGILDTPWKATAPYTVTAYDPAYLLSLRMLDEPVTLEGDVAEIVGELIDLVNEQEELYLRLGNTEGISSVVWTRAFDQTAVWDQLNALGIETGNEIIIRPERVGGRLILYVDLSPRFGIETGFQLFDGDGGNMRIKDAQVIGRLRNRVIGVAGQSTKEDRLQSEPFLDDKAVGIYRLRSEVKQFSEAGELGVLEDSVVQYVAANARPRLKLTAEIYEAAFPYLDLGNVLDVQASKVYLPGGRHGWTGEMRVVSMVFEEVSNMVTVSMEAAL